MIRPHLPERFAYGLKLYLEEGVLPGGFLTAVLENDLKGSLAAADDQSVRELPGLVSYLYNEIPSTAWGSPENVEQWIDFVDQRRRADMANGDDRPDA